MLLKLSDHYLLVRSSLLVLSLSPFPLSHTVTLAGAPSTARPVAPTVHLLAGAGWSAFSRRGAGAAATSYSLSI